MKKENIFKIIFAFLGLLLFAILWFRKPIKYAYNYVTDNTMDDKFTNILNPLKIRSDSAGDGRFDAPRAGANGSADKTHNGVDFLCTEGQVIYAPFDGKITRVAYPYVGSKLWTGIVIEGNGFAAKMFYMKGYADLIGKEVVAGQAIGFAQAISKKYPRSAMKDHIHFELRLLGKLIDPTKYFVLG